MGIHESQSLSFEMQLGRSPAFLALIAPLVKKHLGDQSAFTAENLARLYTRVQPGFIRVDADELTYPAHVILRYEIERDLMNGEDAEPDDIPVLWDKKWRTTWVWTHAATTRTAACRTSTGPAALLGTFPATHWVRCCAAAPYFASIRRAHPRSGQPYLCGRSGAGV